MTDLGEGNPAPPFSLPVEGGGTATLDAFRGRRLVLYFYPKDDTSGCTRQAQEFDALADQFGAAGCALLGVSPDSVKSHQRFRAKHGLLLPLASDPDKSAANAYAVWKQKSMYGRQYRGVERSTFLIDGAGRVVKIWRKVNVPGHAAEVLTAAKQLVACEANK